MKSRKRKSMLQSGQETSSEVSLVLACGSAPYLTHSRLPFKCGHGSRHYPLHSTRLRNGEILQRERHYCQDTVGTSETDVFLLQIGEHLFILCFL